MADSIDELPKILDRTNEWLKFAEAKNGAILVLNTAILFGVAQSLNSQDVMPDFVKWYAIEAMVFLFAAIVFSTISLIPRLTPPLWMRFPSAKDSPNIFYFGDICSLTPESFLNTYYNVLGITNKSSKLDFQCTNQIITNSKIAYIKYLQFNISAWFTLCAFLTPIGDVPPI